MKKTIVFITLSCFLLSFFVFFASAGTNSEVTALNASYDKSTKTISVSGDATVSKVLIIIADKDLNQKYDLGVNVVNNGKFSASISNTGLSDGDYQVVVKKYPQGVLNATVALKIDSTVTPSSTPSSSTPSSSAPSSSTHSSSTPSSSATSSSIHSSSTLSSSNHSSSAISSNSSSNSKSSSNSQINSSDHQSANSGHSSTTPSSSKSSSIKNPNGGSSPLIIFFVILFYVSAGVLIIFSQKLFKKNK